MASEVINFIDMILFNRKLLVYVTLSVTYVIIHG